VDSPRQRAAALAAGSGTSVLRFHFDSRKTQKPKWPYHSGSVHVIGHAIFARRLRAVAEYLKSFHRNKATISVHATNFESSLTPVNTSYKVFLAVNKIDNTNISDVS
jgi:hypothetical protein